MHVVVVVHLLLESNGMYIIKPTDVASASSERGMLTLPGGEVLPNETLEEACYRFLKKEEIAAYGLEPDGFVSDRDENGRVRVLCAYRPRYWIAAKAFEEYHWAPGA